MVDERPRTSRVLVASAVLAPIGVLVLVAWWILRDDPATLTVSRPDRAAVDPIGLPEFEGSPPSTDEEADPTEAGEGSLPESATIDEDQLPSHGGVDTDESLTPLPSGSIVVRVRYEGEPFRDAAVVDDVVGSTSWSTEGFRVSIARRFEVDEGSNRTSSQPFEAEDTDATGSVRFDDLARGDYVIYVSQSGSLRPVTSPEHVRLESSAASEVVEVVLPAAVRLRGRVVDGNDEPIERASIRAIWRESRRTFRSVDTDSEGRFDLLLLARSADFTSAIDLDVRHDRYERVDIDDLDVEMFSESDLGTIVLDTPTANASGRLVDEEGRPIRTRIAVRPLTSDAARDKHTGSKRDGTFEIEGLSPGRYELDPRGRDWVEPVIVAMPAPVVDIELGDVVVRSSAHRLRGVLVDENGRPLEGGYVVASRRGGSATTDAEGRFEIDTERIGPFDLTAGWPTAEADRRETRDGMVPPLRGRLDGVLADGSERRIVARQCGLLVVLRSDDERRLRHASSYYASYRAEDRRRRRAARSWVSEPPRCRFEGAGPGTVEIYVNVEGFEPVHRTVVLPPDVKEREFVVEIELEPDA